MKSQNKKSDQWVENDQAVYVPDEIYHSIQNIFEKMKDAQRELRKVREEIKPAESLSSI